MSTASEPAPGVSPSVDRLRLSGPAQLLQGIPYILGYQPELSVVMLGLAPPRGRVKVSVRFDLDTPEEVVLPWLATAEREGCDELLIVVYDESAPALPLPHREMVDQWTTRAAEHSLDVRDVLLVVNQRWWSYSCKDETCCPSTGNEMGHETQIAATAVSYGMVAVPRRSDLVGELVANVARVADVRKAIDEVDERTTRRLTGEGGFGSVRRARATSIQHVESMLSTFTSEASQCTPADVALALLALGDVAVRDALIATVPERGSQAALGFWRDLTICAPPHFAAAPATLYALAAFAGGDGTRTNIGLDRALADEPDYRLAILLDAAASGGIRPSLLVPELVAGARKERERLLRRGRQSGAPI